MKKLILFGTLTLCCLSAALSAGCSKGQTGGNTGSDSENVQISGENHTNGNKKGKFGDKLPNDFKFVAPDLRTNDRFNSIDGLNGLPTPLQNSADDEQPSPEQPIPEPAPQPTPRKPKRKCHPHLFDGKCPDGKCPDGKCPDGKCPENNDNTNN